MTTDPAAPKFQRTRRAAKSSAPCGCTVEVRWYPNNVTGKRALVNMTPDPNGNVVLEGDVYRVLKKHEMGNTPLFDAPTRYTLHFATCPKASAFRRRDTKAHRAKKGST